MQPFGQFARQKGADTCSPDLKKLGVVLILVQEPQCTKKEAFTKPTLVAHNAAGEASNRRSPCMTSATTPCVAPLFFRLPDVEFTKVTNPAEA